MPETNVQDLLKKSDRFKDTIALVYPHKDHLSVGAYYGIGKFGDRFQALGTEGELVFEWSKLTGINCPYLRAFDDAWEFLALISPLLMPILAEANDKQITTADLVKKLKAIGFLEGQV